MRGNKAPPAIVIASQMRLQETFGRKVRGFILAGTSIAHGWSALPGSNVCQKCLGWYDDYRHL